MVIIQSKKTLQKAVRGELNADGALVIKIFGGGRSPVCVCKFCCCALEMAKTRTSTDLILLVIIVSFGISNSIIYCSGKKNKNDQNSDPRNPQIEDWFLSLGAKKDRIKKKREREIALSFPFSLFF